MYVVGNKIYQYKKEAVRILQSRVRNWNKQSGNVQEGVDVEASMHEKKGILS